jgi:peroxiredoxin Q/BCP
MKLNKGDVAPDFTVDVSTGGKWMLGDRKGKKRVVVSFLRYLGCPFCQQRIHELNAKMDDFAKAGVDVIAILEGTVKRVTEYGAKHGIRLPVGADKEKRVFELYGAGRGKLTMMLKPHVLTRTIGVTLKGYMHGMPGGDELQLPADFIIGKDGKVELAHYGTDPTDSLPVDELLAALGGK